MSSPVSSTLNLVFDEAIADRIRDMFRSRGRDMPENNLRQAMVPEGAHTIEQQPGTAPGLVVPVAVSGGRQSYIRRSRRSLTK